jgi:polar amino acid transport system substrate-binding protein
LLTACSPAHQSAHPPLVVGMELTYPPFETIGPDGSPQGVSVEMAQALGQYLGRPVRIENIPFVGLIPSLQAGKIEVIISSMTRTEEREQSIAFSDPYLTIGLAILAGKDSAIHRPEDLDRPEHTIAVRHGTTGQVWARDHLRQAAILVLDKENAAVLEVIQGKADAFIFDQMSLWQQAQLHPETTRVILEPLRTESWAIGLRRGEEELRAQINAFLADFREKGGFEKLGERYLKEQKEAFAELGLPFYF